MQKFRIDYEGQRSLKLNENTHLTFKIPRQGELLLDAFLVMNLPDIWSPIIPPTSRTDSWRPYQFRWISHIGAHIIKKARVIIGGQTIQEFSGEYLKNMVDRDFSSEKKDFFYKMIGHEKELYSPEYAYNRINRYPHSFYLNEPVEPSIRGRTLYIPLHFWFMNSVKMALPLVSLQYQEIQISLELRPIRELFTIYDTSLTKEQGFSFTAVQPNFTLESHAMYRFLQQPPSIELDASRYENKPTTWDSDIHLMTTYAFLTDEEARTFAANEQRYLIKDIQESIHTNITGNKRIRIETSAMVSLWMWNFRRSDAYKRNEWSNYTNWEYENVLPDDLIFSPEESSYSIENIFIGPGTNFVPSTGILKTIPTTYYVNPPLSTRNVKQILNSFSILFDGTYRESAFSPGVYNLIEKYKNSNGMSNDGLYCYSYSLNTSPFELQPSGAINLSKFKTIELDVSTILPRVDTTTQFQVLCDTEGKVIGTTEKGSMYIYNYDFYLTEERYNLLRFVSGQAALLYAR
jgi:hypothetical protein